MNRKHSAQRIRCHRQNPAAKRSTHVLVPSIVTGGEFFPDGPSISLVRDSSTERLNLLLADGNIEVIDSVVEYAGRTYVPPDLADSFQQAIVFPEAAQDFGSTTALFADMKTSIMNFGLPEHAALVAVYFLLSSWFVEVLPAAPLLLISGPRAEASVLLALLSCLARHPLPLVQITAGSLRSLPMNLSPTLLIDDELISDPLFRLLSVSRNRNANMVVKSGVVNTYGAKALYCGALDRGDPFGDAALQIHLFSSERMLPILTYKDRQELAARFQPKLLAYLVRNIAQVAAAPFDYAGVGKEVRPLAGLLAACIVDAPELRAGLGPLLEAQHDRSRAERWVEPRCVTIEAILSRCHRRQKEGEIARVGEIALDVAAILKGRGEALELEPKAIGAILRGIGLVAKRDSSGYGFALTKSFSRKIHELARQFDVATVQEGRTMCCQCSEPLSATEKTLADRR